MALFGKKKGNEPADLGFGFPAGNTPNAQERLEFDMPSLPGEEKIMPEPVPEASVMQQQQSAPTYQQANAPQYQQPRVAPAPVMMPQPQIAPVQQPDLSLEPRPVIPRAMPEDIMPPRAPEITTLRPHIFLKIDKYKEVMGNIDRINTMLRDLKRTLDNLKEMEEKESLKIKDSDAVLMEMDAIAKRFDQIFTNPTK